MSDLESLNARDDLRELAERYEQVVALDLTALPSGGTGIGARLPPGAQEVLDEDEIMRALTKVDDWAEFTSHVLVDECDETAPDLTPARLRLVAQHTAHFLDHDDEWLALAFRDELDDHLHTMRRLAARADRKIRTGQRCIDATCKGQLISPLGEGDRHDDALRCDRCGRRVEFSVWSSWPRARVKFITVEHAARLLGTTVPAVKMRASRMRWHRIGTGRDVRYAVEDVRHAGGGAT